MKKYIVAAVTIIATAVVATLAYNHYNAVESDDSTATDGSVEPSETAGADAPAADAEIHASDIM